MAPPTFKERRDPNTCSNYDTWLCRHTTAELIVDFKAKRLHGNVELKFELQPNRTSNEIILDTSHVDVKGVWVREGKSWIPTPCVLQPRKEPNGSPLHITVPQDAGLVVELKIDVSTTDKCTALQWLNPEQTSDKKAPFMFSQAQAIHARSLFPCQDTPAVKSTYTFRIKSPHPVIASGLPVISQTDKEGKPGIATGELTTAPAEEKLELYLYEQNVPIPSYLFALASGNIVWTPIGKNSVVATGPNELDASRWELEQDMDKFMAAAEKIIGKYQWGQYNVLVLPPSFPYGGMENPVYTFATPTIISGDRQNVDVIAHELSHSWSGNLVTSCSWEHFWLNEGWTMYLERRIIAEVHGSSAYFDFSAIIGWKALEGEIDRLGKDHPFTKLCIKHEGIDPDDAFSTVPYEKGFHFVYYLDCLVGRENFDKFIQHYFKVWAYKSLNSDDFKTTFLDFFNESAYPQLQEKIAEIGWETRFDQTGLPPKPVFDRSLVEVCDGLAEKWKQPDFSPSPSDVSSWTGNQKLVFLNAVQDFESPLTAAQSEALGRTYGFLELQNVELKAAYYEIALQARDEAVYQGVADLLGRVGRMKFVRPLFKRLNEVDRPLALQTFEKNKDFYHPICRQMVGKDLGLA